MKHDVHLELFKILKDHNSSLELLEQAAWGLSNIAGDSPNARNLIIKLDSPKVFIELIESHMASDEVKHRKLVKTTAWGLCNLLRGKPRVPLNLSRQALPTIIRLMSLPYIDEDTLVDCIWALTYITDEQGSEDPEIIEMIIKNRPFLDLLAGILNNPKKSISIAALRTFGNLCSYDNATVKRVLEVDVLPRFSIMLDSSHKATLKETCWTLSNILTASSDEIQDILKSGIIDKLIQLASDPAQNQEVIKEVVWALSNTTCGAS